MPSSPRGPLLAALRRFAPADPPAAPDDADADLLGRFVAGRDEPAFAALVRRHGPMVLGVCRRRLGVTADADDAFQVVFHVLARDAAKVVARESLAGWLYRVAYLVALKWSGKMHRRPTSELTPDAAADRGPGPESAAAGAELQAIVGEELNALPDKLRAVVVLCGLEERTNAEAAKLLGCPTGTVDSRLAAARAKLRVRLARRGVVAPAAAAGLFVEPLASANAVPESLLSQTVRAAAEYAAAGAGVDPISSFADGVSPTMSTLKFKLLLAAGMSAAVLGTAGYGLFAAGADDAPTPAAGLKAVAVAPAPVADKPKDPPEAKKPPKSPPKTEAGVRDALDQPVGDFDPEGLTFKALLDALHEKYGVTARIDKSAFRRLTAPEQDDGGQAISEVYERKVRVPITRGMTVGDLLTDALADLPMKSAYRIRGGQVSIVPAYLPPVAPGVLTLDGASLPTIDGTRLSEQLHGEPVSFVADGKTLADAVRDLRKLTGANIVIDARVRDKAKVVVDGAFNDTRLLTVLQVLGDMADLKPVTLNNVFYLTDAKNAEKLQKQVNRELAGPVPAGPGTLPDPVAGLTDAEKSRVFVDQLRGIIQPPAPQPPAPQPPAPQPPPPAADPAALKDAVREALKDLLAPKPAQP